ncbi:MAG: signal peptidase I [Planctomycetota bacterium]
MKANEPKKRKSPWRDNIEAFAVAVIMAVVLKYFVLEAYKIPTGSMQPTLMGNDETGIFDRVLVDKLSFHFRDPQRFEVATFKYPLDRSKNFIKRIVGMPGEQLWIAHGDLWSRKDEREPWKILHRPRPVQRETWKPLDYSREGDAASWAGENHAASTWKVGPRSVVASGEGRARFVGRSGAIMDNYTDGYPRGVQSKIGTRGASGQNPVGDLRVEGEVSARADCKLVAVEFDEGTRRYRLEIPGPAAAADAKLRIVALDGGPQIQASVARDVQSEKPYRLPAGKSVSFGAQNLDDQLSLDIAGDVVLSVDIELASDQHSSAWLACEGGEAKFQGLQVYRDIYYTEGRGESKYEIPAGHYFMMGDNTQDSSDSREWNLYVMEASIDGKTQEIRGNNRFRENPVALQTERGQTTWFRDEWGELSVLPSQNLRQLPPENAPFVPRELMTGRALLVFWPFSWQHRVARLKWIH